MARSKGSKGSSPSPAGKAAKAPPGGSSTRSQTVKLYWRRVKTIAARTGMSIAEARQADTVRGVAVRPGGRSARQRQPLRRVGPEASSSRSRALKAYHALSTAYASTVRRNPSEVRSDPEFRRLYQAYVTESRAFSAAPTPAARKKIGRRLSKVMFDIGLIDQAERKAYDVSPELMFQRMAALERR